MPTHYEIRQQVSTVSKNWLEVIDQSEYLRGLQLNYDNLVASRPNEYFEPVKVTRDEECLAFTPKFD